MGLYKRGKTYWFTIMRNGKRVQLSAETENKKMAEERYAETLIAIKTGECFKSRKQQQKFTFNDLANRYADWAEGRQRSWRKARHYMAGQLVRYFGGYELNSISTDIVEQYQSFGLKRGLHAGGVNRLVGLFKSMFTKAVDWEMASEDVLKRVRKVKSIKGEISRLRYLSIEECQTLVHACDPRLRSIVITALNTGMRRGEILGLKWDQVDLRHGYILLDNSTKTGARREIPINSGLRDALQGITRRLDIPYVFYDPATGKPYMEVKKSFASALIRAGIKDFHFHDLRHTFASQLVMAGVDIATVSKLLGHKSLNMTLRYSHLAPNHLSKAVESICYNFATVADFREIRKIVTP